MTEAQYYPITKDELNRIKNDCIHPETDSCPYDCECGGKDDCTFSANTLMDEVLSRSPISSTAKSDAVLDDNLITEIIGTLTITEGFVPTAIRSEVMRLRERLTKELRRQHKEP